MNQVDITGLDKKEVLKQLWIGSEPAIAFVMANVDPPGFDPEEAEKAIKRGYVDYLCGRAIKSPINTNTLDSWKYDRYNGAGSMQKAVDRVKEVQKYKPAEVVLSGDKGSGEGTEETWTEWTQNKCSQQ
jgi:hypothetical protein